jgi:beta-phosphoglucomutase family hydrolase
MPQYTFESVVFDLDGVITQTAKVHSHAWKKMFDNYLKTRETEYNEPFKPFTQSEYLAYVDGKPRYDGVKSFLESRNIEIPFGTPDDRPEKETVCGLGNKKNAAFNEVLSTEGVEVYPSTVAFMKALKDAGVKVGVASSSKNCEVVLKAAGLEGLVETRVDGVVSAELGLNGKPAPDIFLTAARNLGANPHNSVVVEDAVSGVAAGRNGNFGLVLGIAREDNTAELRRNGADIVVADMEEIDMNDVEEWFQQNLEEDNWKLEYHDYDPKKERSREALLAIGNGYFGTRGAMEESVANNVNYPGTYVAGIYNRLVTKIQDRDVVNEDFVNCPQWSRVRFKVDDGLWVDINQVEILSILRRLDFKTGVLHREMTIKDEEGNISLIESERFGSMNQPHLAALRYKITPINYSGTISICTALDGAIQNEGVERYKDLSSKHLQPVDQGGERYLSWLKVRTNQSKIEICEAAKISLKRNGREIETEIAHTSDEGVVYSILEQELVAGESLELEKVVAIFTSKEEIYAMTEALGLASIAGSYEDILKESVDEREKLWDEIDIRLEGNRLSQKLLRLHLYHLLISASKNNENLDASVTARGLHGEAYRGHIFWDELFILPFYDIHYPKTARSLLMYRYRRLEKAREYAKENDFKGAMYPWQSGSDGSEETQVVHLNPVSGEWGPDHSSLQRHVSLAVAYDVWEYFHVSQDKEFLEKYGMEMFLEICRFWESKTKWNEKYQRYSIGGVMGPDEFHEKYSDTEEGGLTDNAYTNIMVAWLFKMANNLLSQMDSQAKADLFRSLNMNEEEVNHWQDLRKKLRLVISEDGIIAQYDGYFELKELDWDYYRQKYGNVYRMDRLLKAEGKSADEYKVAKQADMLMTFYNLDKEEVDVLLSEMGYQLPEDYLTKNLDYYLKRTSHGSTLSRVVHAQLAQMIGDKNLSWELYSDALSSDFNDIQGGTTGEGIHAGVMAGTILIALSTYAGIQLRKENLEIIPSLPESWDQLKFQMNFKNVFYSFSVNNGGVSVMADQDVKIKVFDKEVSLKAGEEVLISK